MVTNFGFVWSFQLQSQSVDRNGLQTFEDIPMHWYIFESLETVTIDWLGLELETPDKSKISYHGIWKFCKLQMWFNLWLVEFVFQ